MFDRDDLDTENGKKVKDAFKKYREGEIDSEELIKEVKEAGEEDTRRARNKVWWFKLKG